MTGSHGRALLCAALLLCGCAGSKDSLDITKPVTGAEATNAERAYKRGIAEKADKNYIEATRYLEWVRTNFPYSQYSSLAELAIADMAYEREDWGAAAAAYQDFVKSHPSHPKADYASFRVGLAYYQDKPSDFWLMPPSDEKDQTPIRSALDALQRFVISYPKSDLVPKARDIINACRERLAAHDKYVAEFYWKRNAWKGAAVI
jgi:outer membrane protein assembly factor BamD